MASRARSTVTPQSVFRALNTPGGPVYEWRDDTAGQIVLAAEATAPINDVLNALHRGGLVGEFKRSFTWDAVGSNQVYLRATVYNYADHALYAEEGRGPSSKQQTFSWAGWGGATRTTGSTRGRDGSHTLRNATNAVLAQAPGVFTPLT